MLAAATVEFAAKGLHGASTEEIARGAGISQPYLFRLFGSKKGLYLATVQRCGDELHEVFAAAAEGKSGTDALVAMGDAYGEIMQDRTRLMLMLKAWTASDDPDVRSLNRRAWRNLVDLAEQASREPPEVVSAFFANGMLITILMSLGFTDDPEPWSERLIEACKQALDGRS